MLFDVKEHSLFFTIVYFRLSCFRSWNWFVFILWPRAHIDNFRCRSALGHIVVFKVIDSLSSEIFQRVAADLPTSKVVLFIIVVNCCSLHFSGLIYFEINLIQL